VRIARSIFTGKPGAEPFVPTTLEFFFLSERVGDPSILEILYANQPHFDRNRNRSRKHRRSLLFVARQRFAQAGGNSEALHQLDC
jgi:hypothetical protein